jgi:hypothetical protein
MLGLRIFLLAIPAFSQITSITAHPGGAWTSCSGSSPTISCTAVERQRGYEVNPIKITTAGTFGSTSTSTAGMAALTYAWCKLGTGATRCAVPASGDSTPELYPQFDGYTDDGYGPTTFGGSTCAGGGVYSANTCTYTGSITFTGGFTINVKLVVYSYLPPAITYPKGRCTGCTNSNRRYPDPDTVTVSNFVPPGNFIPPASAGGSYIDPNYGGTIYTVQPPLANNMDPGHNYAQAFDALVTTFNSDNTLLLTQKSNGDLYIHSTVSPYPVLWTTPCAGAGSHKWSSTDPKTFYYVSGKSIGKGVLTTPGNATCSTVYTYPGTSNGGLSDGGDGDITTDNWWFVTACDGRTCAAGQDDNVGILVNLNTGAAYTCDFTSLRNTFGFTARDSQVSNIDAVTGKRYLVIDCYPGAASELFQFDGTAITDMGPYPAAPGIWQVTHVYDGNGACLAAAETANSCWSASHAGICQIAGVQGRCSAVTGRQHSSYDIMVFNRFSTGPALMGVDAAAGGGATIIMPYNDTSDTHIGNARRGNVSVVTSNSSPGVTSWKVTGVNTRTNPVTITSDAAYSGANGDLLTMSNIQGTGTIPTLNGAKTCIVANRSGVTFQCSGLNLTGIYTAGTGAFFLGTQTLTFGPHYLENVVFYMPSLNVAGMTVLRHSSNRSLLHTNDYLDSGYYDQAHGSISQEGSMFSFESNFGYSDAIGVYLGFTGFGTPTIGETTVFNEKNVVQ